MSSVVKDRLSMEDLFFFHSYYYSYILKNLFGFPHHNFSLLSESFNVVCTVIHLADILSIQGFPFWRFQHWFFRNCIGRVLCNTFFFFFFPFFPRVKCRSSGNRLFTPHFKNWTWLLSTFWKNVLLFTFSFFSVFSPELPCLKIMFICPKEH